VWWARDVVTDEIDAEPSLPVPVTDTSPCWLLDARIEYAPAERLYPVLSLTTEATASTRPDIRLLGVEPFQFVRFTVREARATRDHTALATA
jgi:hypothetical protein